MSATTVRLDTVKPETVRWLWPGRIALDKLCVLEGDPGVAKSLSTLNIGARVTTGRAMPDGSYSDLPGPAAVVLVSVEDGLADTIRPRLDMAGADTSRVFAITGVPTSDGYERSIVLPDDWQIIFDVVAEHSARLVVLDPLMALLGGDTNSYRDQDIRRALTPGVMLAEDTGAALLVVRHLNKGNSTNAIYRGGGSIGITGAARSVMVAAKDPDDETGERRILAMTKSNLAASVPALAYRVESPDGVHPRIVWEGHTHHTANDLVSQYDDDQRAVRDEAKEYLADALQSGPKPVTDLLKGARAQGISERTLRRAKKDMGIEKQKQGFGDSGQWVWELPKMATDALRLPTKTVAILAGSGHLSGVDVPQGHRIETCWKCGSADLHVHEHNGNVYCNEPSCMEPLLKNGVLITANGAH